MFLSKINRAAAIAALPLLCAGVAANGAAAERDPLFLTATNTGANGTGNFLAVIDTVTHETTYVPTGGAGGVSGNAGGIAVNGEVAAVINYGSSNVSISCAWARRCSRRS